MKKALIFMANGFEEIEAITLIDILRRAGVQVDMCSINEDLALKGAHDIQVRADILLSDVQDFNAYDALITPGGMPGSAYLRDNPIVTQAIRSFYNKDGKLIASICASPIVLEKAGITSELIGTCYPGFENKVGFKEYRKQAVVIDKNVYTSIGPGTAFCMALKLTEALAGKDKAQALYEQTMLQYS